MDGQIFGSDITLPSLPDLQSGCEEEINLLMKEVDLAFERKHHTLLSELIYVRTLCRSQRDQIEKLHQYSNDGQIENLKDKITQYSNEIEKLRKENDDLKSENSTLQHRIKKMPDGLQLESLKRSLSIQQEENKNLRERLIKSNDQYESLQNSYKKAVSALFSYQSDGNHGRNQVNGASTPSLKEAEIAQTTERFLSEEKHFCNDFLSSINKEIDNLEEKLKKEVF